MHCLQSSMLLRLTEFEHGFGTRASGGVQDAAAWVRQIHSGICLVAEEEGLAGDGDALITQRPGLGVFVKTADCYPVLLADPVRGVAAAAHAGWRGTAAGIVGATLRRMKERFGTSAADVFAAIGPGIGACCYFVGEDVARKFGREDAGKIDLAAANRRQLMEAGVPAEQIEVVGRCTFCDAEDFHSFRRDGERAGRMISFIRMRA